MLRAPGLTHGLQVLNEIPSWYDHAAHMNDVCADIFGEVTVITGGDNADTDLLLRRWRMRVVGP